jgi:hypothetical protein
MQKFIALAGAVFLAASPMASAAQPYDGGWRPPESYGSYDPCQAARAEAGHNGAVTGGVLGAIAGAAIAGRGSRAGGALVGGAVGAVAGNQVARNNVSCASYPEGYHRHRHCRWVNDHGHGLEVCRGRDGVWRPWRD